MSIMHISVCFVNTRNVCSKLLLGTFIKFPLSGVESLSFVKKGRV